MLKDPNSCWRRGKTLRQQMVGVVVVGLHPERELIDKSASWQTSGNGLCRSSNVRAYWTAGMGIREIISMRNNKEIDASKASFSETFTVFGVIRKGLVGVCRLQTEGKDQLGSLIAHVA